MEALVNEGQTTNVTPPGPVPPDEITGEENLAGTTITAINPQTTGEQSGEADRTTVKHPSKVASVIMV